MTTRDRTSQRIPGSKIMAQGTFTLSDFQEQMATIRKMMGPIKDTLKMIPGMSKMTDMLGPDLDPEADFRQFDAMINSMTLQEREYPDLIDVRRQQRIADGSGRKPLDVNELLKLFSQMAVLMKNVAGMGMRDRMKMMSQMSQAMERGEVRRDDVREDDDDDEEGDGACVPV